MKQIIVLLVSYLVLATMAYAEDNSYEIDCSVYADINNTGEPDTIFNEKKVGTISGRNFAERVELIFKKEFRLEGYSKPFTFAAVVQDDMNLSDDTFESSITDDNKEVTALNRINLSDRRAWSYLHLYAKNLHIFVECIIDKIKKNTDPKKPSIK